MTTPAAGPSLFTRASALGLTALVCVNVAVLTVMAIGSIMAGDLADAPFLLVFVLLPASLGSVGAVLALRRPENVVGWLLLVAGFLAAFSFACGEYERFAVDVGHPEWPLVVLAGWVSNTWFVPSIGLLVVLLPLVFPTGRLLGPRWRIVAIVGIAGVTMGAVASATAPGPLGGPSGPVNPFVPPEPVAGWIQAANGLSNLLAAPIFVAALASLLIRFRRSNGVERQQIKWLLFAAVITAGTFGVSILGIGELSDAAWFAGLVSMGFLPVAIGVAILRYRLFEIDRIVSRTLAYAVVTATLGLTFAAVVLLLQAVLASVAAVSTLSIAVSTLLVASLFQPLRRRVQRAADRRFNRSRYDAEREIEAFATRVRDEVEVEPLAAAIAETVQRTVQPAAASIWLRRTAA